MKIVLEYKNSTEDNSWWRYLQLALVKGYKAQQIHPMKLTNKMIIKFNLFDFRMNNRIKGKLYNTNIITINSNKRRMRKMKVTKKRPKTINFSNNKSDRSIFIYGIRSINCWMFLKIVRDEIRIKKEDNQ